MEARDWGRGDRRQGSKETRGGGDITAGGEIYGTGHTAVKQAVGGGVMSTFMSTLELPPLRVAAGAQTLDLPLIAQFVQHPPDRRSAHGWANALQF